ncbi:MAG: hypothetical protein UU08_C0004G0036 [Candidatus Uhrbacteria bacterium GW2011_GWE2_40_58]|nr:MAG: hypothetical protein UT94_C0009G0036 [Candidatus Uhrbacteria bacterium GW2011_GWF2_40_263]KKR68049.1 MAG: hypothetical protein UU08_C0004G0036 [Candidatus Uhrbacteria bacterium GW2011_GWE2_40_58]OGL92917.1 MAG: hypothetical protein A2239_04160 [Candidatus Uhrbacteria bacterium RIFOXYA2_FULL_40_9]OGL97055.1 MAG: hypothetical protein A2332_04165 [Candidatus Uhrbacteria bacterium RIFOXYB2_FULL_41_18]HBK34638.1 hypothetical protein [Candidatus Uhrbacteria bacterium]
MAVSLVLLTHEEGERIFQQRIDEDCTALRNFFDPYLSQVKMQRIQEGGRATIRDVPFIILDADVEYFIELLAGKGPWSQERLERIEQVFTPLFDHPEAQHAFIDACKEEVEDPQWLERLIQEFQRGHYQRSYYSLYRTFMLTIFVAFLSTA